MIIEEWPDPEVQDHYLEVRASDTGRVIAVIELLSPANKVARSRGRRAYLRKRPEVLGSDSHWLELDFLRDGERTGALRGRSDYYVLLSRANQRSTLEVWPFDVRDELLTIAAPLRSQYPDVPLDIASAWRQMYDQGRCRQRVNYGRPPLPLLPEPDAAWADAMLREKGLR